MKPAYTDEGAADNVFEKADEAFEELKDDLAGEATGQATHGDLERFVEEDGRELLRRLYQGALDLRNQGDLEDEEQVVGEDGVERTHRIDSERTLMSNFGTVFARRRGHGMKGAETLFVQDAHLNLPGGRKYSHEVQRHLVRQTAQTSFDASIETLEEMKGVEVPKRQAEELTVEAMADFDAFYETRSWPAGCRAEGTIQVLSFDEGGIPMRDEALTDETRRRKEEAGDETTRKRQAMTTALYTVEPHVRDLEDIVGQFGEASEGAETAEPPEPKYKRVWASVRKSSEEVMRNAFEEALLRDPEQNTTWVALVDGDPKLEGRIRDMADEYGVEVVVVIDIVHLLEYLWGAGRALYGRGDPQTGEWVTERLRRVLEGRAAGVARGMRQSATKRGFDEGRREPIDECAEYIQKRLESMNYDTCLEEGYPIATGVIEGAVRWLIRDRMDITGARWGLDGAEAVLQARALLKNGDFEEYWRFHEAAEQQRNHRENYEGGEIPAMTFPGKSTRLRATDSIY